MKNVTVTLDDETARWARMHAAEQNQSLSRFLGELLSRTMRESHAYEAAMRRYLSRTPSRPEGGAEQGGKADDYPSRQDLYDRTDVR
jgi:hypothetical protein